MNYINALISLNSDDSSIAERMEGKKTLFGFGNALEIHKLVYGFFMDAYKAESHERDAYEGLSKYEFFAGSLTCQRLCKEMNAFLNSPLSDPLDHETKMQLRAFVKLLEDSQELSHLIDLHRSSYLRCLFLAATGKGSSVADTTIELEPEHLQALTASALKKVNALEPGQQALFLLGSVLHETLLRMERIDPTTFSIRYYDPALGSFSYIADEIILKETFWNELYTLKFSKASSDVGIALSKHLDRLGIPKSGERHSESYLSPQRKNTCHFRCYLALLKDQMIRRSPLALQDAYEEWHLFKVSFGQFLLESEHLRNELLIDFSKKHQEKRVQRQDKADQFLLCIQKGMFEETYALYEALASKLSACFGERKFLPSFDNNPLKTLLHAEKILLKQLANYPVSPDDVRPFFENAQNPWIERSFARFEEAYRKKEARFQNGLREELEAATEWNRTLEPLKRSAYAFLRTVSFDLFPMRSSSQPIPPRVAGNEEQVQELLDLFESTPEMLHFIREKPCFFAILIQAIQLGKIEQLERIYHKLPEEDQDEIRRYCDQQHHILFPLALPDRLKDYVLQHPNSPFIDILVVNLCLKAWHNGQFLDYFKMSQVHHDHFVLKSALMQDIPQDKIVECLAGLDSFSKETEGHQHPYTKEILFRAKNGLLEAGNGSLRDAVRHFTIPGLQELLEKKNS